jgi:hypothetical protein
MSHTIFVIKKRDHIQPDVVEKSRLVNRNIDHMIPCPEKEVGFFGGFNTDR